MLSDVPFTGRTVLTSWVRVSMEVASEAVQTSAVSGWTRWMEW